MTKDGVCQWRWMGQGVGYADVCLRAGDCSIVMMMMMMMMMMTMLAMTAITCN